MANPCEDCTFKGPTGCTIEGVRSGVKTLVRREHLRGAPDDDMNRRLLALCEMLDEVCEDYRSDVAFYELAEQFGLNANES
jgi:Holliday junction resolvasome RuvABC endonuclease subunit